METHQGGCESSRASDSSRQQTADSKPEAAPRGRLVIGARVVAARGARGHRATLGTSKGSKDGASTSTTARRVERGTQKVSLQSDVDVYPASFCGLQIRGITDVRHLSLVSASWVKANFEIAIWVGGARCIGANPDAVNPALLCLGLAPGRGCPMGHGPWSRAWSRVNGQWS